MAFSASDYMKLREQRLSGTTVQSGQPAAASVPADDFTSKYMALRQERITKDIAAELQRIPSNINSQGEPQKSNRTWFNAGEFRDGYQFGDVTKTILGTGADTVEGLQAGILGATEGVVDTGAYIAGGIGGFFGANDFKNDMGEFIKQDLINEREIARKGNLMDVLLMSNGTNTDNSSLLGDKSDSLVQSGGQLLATAGLQAVGVPWYVTTGLTSFGGEANNALNQGATFEQAGVSSAVSAGAEILTEKLFGGSGLGEKGLINLEPITKGISSKLVKALADFGIDMASEGAEEVVSQFASNLGSKLYREENLNDILFSEEAIDGYIESFIAGAAMGGFANVRKLSGSIKDARSNNPSPQQTASGADITQPAAAQSQSPQSSPADPLGAAVEGCKATGTVTNKQAQDILNNTKAVTALLEQTGIKLPDTASGRRNAVKQAVAQLAQQAQTGSQADVLPGSEIDTSAQNAPATEAPTAQPRTYTDELLDELIPANPNRQAIDTVQPQAYTDKLLDEIISAKSAHDVGKTEGHKRSKVYTNTYKNATGEAAQSIGQAAQQLDPNIANYDPITEIESFTSAAQRIQTLDDINQQYQQLVSKEGWTGEDNDTAMLVMDHLRRSGDTARFVNMARAQRAQATQGGQLVQSFAKYTRTPTSAAAAAMETLDSFGPNDVPRKFWHGKNFDAWKGGIASSILDISNRIEVVNSSDAAGMRDVVRALANFRRTTAWFGTSNNLTKAAERALSKLDYEKAKDIAIAQLSQIPGDFKKRSAGEIVKTIRIYNMLSSISTVNRNIVGNASVGIVDAVSDSTVGRALDALVSYWTGKRTVGNDVTHAKTYFNAAVEAAEMASLCAGLDIPMDSESRYSAGPTRTFSPQGGPIARFFSAYEKGMKYALEVTDKFFEGGTRSAVDESLRELGAKANLTEDQIQSLSQKAGQRRTFKDDRKLAKAAKGTKKALNELGTESIGVGDLSMPFAGTGSNVTQTAIDYTGGGIFSGLFEIAKVAKDVKNGKQVDVLQQRKAVTDAARSITGIGLISVFAALAAKGIISVHDDDDKDERALDQSLGLSGAQFNVDAMLRAFAGEDTMWQDGDWTVSVDFLEPFNAQMYVGYILSQEDTVADMVKAYPKAAVSGVAQSILDMPMMQSLSDTVDLASGALESFAEGEDTAFADAAGQMLGNYGSSFIPSWVRQTAYMADPYYRDTTGDNAMEKAANQIKSNIPGLSQTLPKKYSGFGEEQLRHEGGVSGFFNTYINPGKISQISTSDIANSLDRISEASGKKTIYPDYIAPGSFSYTDENGVKQTVTISGKEMTETYQKTYGENVAGLYSDLLSMDYFNSLDAQTQAAIMESAKSYATKLARASVSVYSEIPEYIKKKPADMSEAEALIRQKLVGTTTMYTDISISSAVYVHDLLDSLKDLPRETKADGTPYTNVREIQKLEAVAAADENLTQKEQTSVIEDIIGGTALADKYATILGLGYDNDVFVESYRMELSELEKADTIRSYMREFGISYAAAQKLYKIYNPPKK